MLSIDDSGGGIGTIQMVPWNFGYIPAHGQQNRFETDLALTRQSYGARYSAPQTESATYTAERRLSVQNGSEVGTIIDIYA